MSSFFIPLAYRSPGEILLKLLQGPALSFRDLAPEVEQREPFSEASGRDVKGRARHLPRRISPT
jgi:hypothetical protein